MNSYRQSVWILLQFLYIQFKKLFPDKIDIPKNAKIILS